MSDTAKLLEALRPRHARIDAVLGDDGLYGAMAGYTGQSHLGEAIKSDLLTEALTGAGTGALTTSLIFPALGMPISAQANKYGLLYGAGTGAALGALSSIAKYYLGRGTAAIASE